MKIKRIISKGLFLALWVFFYFGANAVQFSKKKIQVGSQKMVVEVAESDVQAAAGLMFRTKLDFDTGMLFIFPNEDIRSFWMKNTFIPLSIAFIDSKFKIVDIQDMEPVKSEMQADIPTYQSSKPAKYALEVNRGFFKKRNIKVGDKLKLD